MVKRVRVQSLVLRDRAAPRSLCFLLAETVAIEQLPIACLPLRGSGPALLHSQELCMAEVSTPGGRRVGGREEESFFFFFAQSQDFCKARVCVQEEEGVGVKGE